MPAVAYWNPPAWWCAPEQQFTRARQLWPYIVLPGPPERFTPRTKSEVLLLHVPDSFDSLWDKVEALPGYIKFRSEFVTADVRNLRPLLGKREFTGPVWLAFDPEHGKGQDPKSLWHNVERSGQLDLAASEVLSALIQFTEWMYAWSAGGSASNLAGYQLKYDGSWSDVPCLGRADGSKRLMLRSISADYQDVFTVSPSVREC